jgi:hypothetical protein
VCKLQSSFFVRFDRLIVLGGNLSIFSSFPRKKNEIKFTFLNRTIFDQIERLFLHYQNMFIDGNNQTKLHAVLIFESNIVRVFSETH